VALTLFAPCVFKNQQSKMTEPTDMMILHLPVKAKWYDMQESGEKPEEYREITPFWYQRLYRRKKEFAYVGPLTRNDAEYACAPDLRYILKGEGFKDNELRPYTHVLFRYGYTRRTFLHRIDSITVGRGNPAWGAPKDRDVFIIRHHKE
jgi:hypothetical protein